MEGDKTLDNRVTSPFLFGEISSVGLPLNSSTLEGHKNTVVLSGSEESMGWAAVINPVTTTADKWIFMKLAFLGILAPYCFQI